MKRPRGLGRTSAKKIKMSDDDDAIHAIVALDEQPDTPDNLDTRIDDATLLLDQSLVLLLQDDQEQKGLQLLHGCIHEMDNILKTSDASLLPPRLYSVHGTALCELAEWKSSCDDPLDWTEVMGLVHVGVDMVMRGWERMQDMLYSGIKLTNKEQEQVLTACGKAYLSMAKLMLRKGEQEDDMDYEEVKRMAALACRYWQDTMMLYQEEAEEYHRTCVLAAVSLFAHAQLLDDLQLRKAWLLWAYRLYERVLSQDPTHQDGMVGSAESLLGVLLAELEDLDENNDASMDISPDDAQRINNYGTDVTVKVKAVLDMARDNPSTEWDGICIRLLSQLAECRITQSGLFDDESDGLYKDAMDYIQQAQSFADKHAELSVNEALLELLNDYHDQE